MIKNIIIAGLLLICATSIYFNFNSHNRNIKQKQFEEERTNETFHKLALLRAPHNLTHAQGDSVAFIKETQKAIMTVEYELIEMSGGTDSLTGKLINTYGTNNVNEYFYSDNLKRPFASNYMDSIINSYVRNMDQLGLKSSLRGSTIQTDTDYFFKNLTVSEAIFIMEFLKNRISFDERRIINGC